MNSNSNEGKGETPSFLSKIKSLWKQFKFNLFVKLLTLRLKGVSPLVTYPFMIFLHLDAKEYNKTHNWDETIKYIKEYPDRLEQAAKEKAIKDAHNAIVFEKMDHTLERLCLQDPESNPDAFFALLDDGFTQEEIADYNNSKHRLFMLL